ncbi:MAG: hypothetical protein RJA21_1990 [Gemmatimonadota bacterium]|jgi:hypothetical protein
MSVSPAPTRRSLAVDTLALHVGLRAFGNLDTRTSEAFGNVNGANITVGVRGGEAERHAADADQTTITVLLRSKHAA